MYMYMYIYIHMRYYIDIYIYIFLYTYGLRCKCVLGICTVFAGLDTDNLLVIPRISLTLTLD